ncbi:uncharacterized protein LOC111686241 isoform X1 [Lucilia cuprina]|uniref:uncharacterized protein LOC111686241 isoform X1 n=1 Tax=Lucilia cuprina TaxID=7375 RepID=UPI001F0698AA|nr:uncharacterized protein LOC111686241 isoform X1 [Lucilia cuprina]XP_046805406.1 uncharacterized protein LOC111686241 isoform X1 [Lucilia cuprina]
MGSIDKACISGFLCRLCSEMHRIVIHIYGDQGQRLCLVEKINGYLPITISPTDPLPKTICTTCLRRVEQHYDLLMRLSRIKKERFLRFNNKQRPRVSPISSIENSEDEVYQSDDESRRRRQQLDITPQRQMTQSEQNFLSTPTATAVSSLFSAATAGSFSTSSSMNTASSSNDHGNEDDDDDSGASTSASALAAITQTITAVNDANLGDSTSSSSSTSSTHPLSADGGSSFGIVLQQHTD